MITIKRIREMAKKENKKIGKNALSKIEDLLEKGSEQIIKRASKNSDFSGRRTIFQKIYTQGHY